MFPEAITKERDVHGVTTAGTDGIWRKFKLVFGSLERLRRRIRSVGYEYSPVRARHAEIDRLHLFEELNQVRSTGIDYWNVAGRVDTISREQVVVIYPSGSRVGLNRDMGFGFRGIITKSPDPWSMEEFALAEMLRYRLNRLHLGIALPGMPIQEPWRLRRHAENYLRALFILAWNEYATEHSMERFENVIEMERRVSDYILDAMRYAHHAGDWEHMKAVPFPDRTGALQLWEHDQLRRLDFDSTAPWWLENPKDTEQEVTVVRQAIINNGKGVTITITMDPVLQRLQHPDHDIEHHMITYNPPTIGGRGVPNPLPGRPRIDRPILTPILGKSPSEWPLGWSGIQTERPGWTAVQAAGRIPEPKLKVKSRPVEIPQSEGENLLAALSLERPVLCFPELNGGDLPALALPRMFGKVDIMPLFTGSRILTPIEERNNISGWVTDDTGVDPNRAIWGPAPPGFLTTPLSGRPIRDGTINEILPY
jgi:hypothetical protein